MECLETRQYMFYNTTWLISKMNTVIYIYILYINIILYIIYYITVFILDINQVDIYYIYITVFILDINQVVL